MLEYVKEGRRTSRSSAEKRPCGVCVVKGWELTPMRASCFLMLFFQAPLFDRH